MCSELSRERDCLVVDIDCLFGGCCWCCCFVRFCLFVFDLEYVW